MLETLSFMAAWRLLFSQCWNHENRLFSVNAIK